MGTKVTLTRRDTGRNSFTWHRKSSAPASASASGKICSFWLAGNCTRNPCLFRHSETVPTTTKRHSETVPTTTKRHSETVPTTASYAAPVNRSAPKQTHYSHQQPKDAPKKVTSVRNESTEKTQYKICEYWVTGDCVYGEKCKYMHSWSYGNGLSRLTQLEGHKKAVTGITLPSGSDKLFSGSKDGTVRVCNCHTGECIGTFEMGSAVGCLISEGAWLFVGIENAVKALNIQTNAELTLSAPGGQVYAMSATDEMLLAGVHDGSILAWKFNAGTNSFEAIAMLKGHAGAVVSLVFGAGRLYSGSLDNTIRAWDLENMQCIHTLNQHSQVVMSMVCWDQYLLSCSLDQTLKIWAATKAGDLEVVYTHKEEHGILSLRGMCDAEGKPILLCSCNDNSVRLYELPSFMERGRVFTRQEVRTIEFGPGGLFFTGDGTGRVSVWRLSGALPDTSP